MKLRKLLKIIFALKREQARNSISYYVWGIELISFKYRSDFIDLNFCPLKKRILSIPHETITFDEKLKLDEEMLSLIASLESLQLIRKNSNSSYLETKNS